MCHRGSETRCWASEPEGIVQVMTIFFNAMDFVVVLVCCSRWGHFSAPIPLTSREWLDIMIIRLLFEKDNDFVRNGIIFCRRSSTNQIFLDEDPCNPCFLMDPESWILSIFELWCTSRMQQLFSSTFGMWVRARYLRGFLTFKKSFCFDSSLCNAFLLSGRRFEDTIQCMSPIHYYSPAPRTPYYYDFIFKRWLRFEIPTWRKIHQRNWRWRKNFYKARGSTAWKISLFQLGLYQIPRQSMSKVHPEKTKVWSIAHGRIRTQSMVAVSSFDGMGCNQRPGPSLQPLVTRLSELEMSFRCVWFHERGCIQQSLPVQLCWTPPCIP